MHDMLSTQTTVMSWITACVTGEVQGFVVDLAPMRKVRVEKFKGNLTVRAEGITDDEGVRMPWWWCHHLLTGGWTAVLSGGHARIL